MFHDKYLEDLKIGEIKPKGWLLKQLELQRTGLTGHLDEIWEDVSENSGWLGGTGENWERGPYYIDGLIPLSYLLSDEQLIRKSEFWIHKILMSQKENGFFGPSDNTDWWPRMIVLKAFKSYFEATNDKRIIDFMLSYLKYQKNNINHKPLKIWAHMRGADEVIILKWLYEITHEKFLYELAKTLNNQTADWRRYFQEFPYQTSMSNYMNWKETEENILRFGWENIEKENNALFYKFHFSHGVNIAMAIKKIVADSFFEEFNLSDETTKALTKLKRYHGFVNGMFSSDEHLSGNNPNQGTELCAVVEMMYSLEKIIQFTEDFYYANLLEKIAFNALPASIAPDFRAHQYDQQPNQIKCTIAERNWYNNLKDSNIFGLEPNFGCCTANMHQGWPKFVKHMWMRKGEEFYKIIYGPSELKTNLKNGDILNIEEKTDYPFGNSITFVIKENISIPVKLVFRIPEWSEGIKISLNRKDISSDINNGSFSITRKWEKEDIIEIEFVRKVKYSKWYKNSVGVEFGPLVFALDLDEKWEKISGNRIFYDAEVATQSPWNFAINCSEDINVHMNEVLGNPFDKKYNPLVMSLKAKKIENWKEENNSAGNIPFSPVKTDSPEEIVKLIPYGTARLRISEFPYYE